MDLIRRNGKRCAPLVYRGRPYSHVATLEQVEASLSALERRRAVRRVIKWTAFGLGVLAALIGLW